MLTDLSSPPRMEASSPILAHQQCPRLVASTNQLHHQNVVLKKPKNILELKIYREQYRSLNFLSFISKKVKNYPRFLGISTIFSKQMPQKREKTERESERKNYKDGVKKVRDGVKSTYLPKNATFYNLLHVQGEIGHVFSQSGANFKDKQFIWKKGMFKMLNGVKKEFT